MMADHREPCDAILKGTQRLAAFIVLFREEDCTVRMLFHPFFCNPMKEPPRYKSALSIAAFLETSFCRKLTDGHAK